MPPSNPKKRKLVTAIRIALFGVAMFGAGVFQPVGALLSFIVALLCIRAVRLRNLVKWPLLLVLGLSGYAMGISVSESSAKSNADAFCNRFPIGEALDVAARAASSEGDPWLRHSDSNEVSVGYTGASVFSRHMCIITAQDGHIAAKRYFYLD